MQDSAPIVPFPAPAPYAQREPTVAPVPVVLASPHSGAYYPPAFVAQARLDQVTLRKSEDCYVDELFSDGPDMGTPLLRALYPRAYVDLNREPYELDPDMFDGPLPTYVNTSSSRVAAGLGTIPRVVGNRREIYTDKLPFTEAVERITQVHEPYHKALRAMVARTREAFGFCILVDCHSMPSSGLPMDPNGNGKPVDIVLGDRNGRSCHTALARMVQDTLTDQGYHVLRNNPYAGGYTTQHYGNPADGIHVLQIEINRILYMDEGSLKRLTSFATIRDNMRQLIDAIIKFGATRGGDLQYQRLSAE